MSEIVGDDYIALVAVVKACVRAAQYEVLRAVNRELIGSYIGVGSPLAITPAGCDRARSLAKGLIGVR